VIKVDLSTASTAEGRTSKEEDDEQEEGKERGKVDDFAGRLHSLDQTQEDHSPSSQQRKCHLHSNPFSVLDAFALL
jgi:hypothetical protein